MIFLDLTIALRNIHHLFEIFRKLTYTDTLINSIPFNTFSFEHRYLQHDPSICLNSPLSPGFSKGIFFLIIHKNETNHQIIFIALVWNPHSVTSSNRLKRVRKRSLKYLCKTFTYYTAHIRTILTRHLEGQNNEAVSAVENKFVCIKVIWQTNIIILSVPLHQERIH